ncbi:MAG: glycosyltransferase [Ilumatobacteraceae bacterium]
MRSVLDPDAPLRLAYFTYRGKPHVGGQGVYTRHLTKALADLGHHVEVFSGQPYPVLDERIELHKLRSLDIFNDQYPGRFPAYWEIKSWADIVEILQFSAGTFSEPLAFSVRAHKAMKARLGDFDLVHDNQCLGYGMLQIESSCRRSSPSTTRSPRTASWRWRTRRTGASGSRSAAGTRSSRCKAGSPAGCRASSS